MNGLCRACLRVADQPKSLFSDDGRLETPAHLIWKCTGVRLMEGDNLPESLCLKCFSNLSIANDFRLLVEKSNSFLLQCNTIKVEFESNSRIEHDTRVPVEDAESKFRIDSKNINSEINDNTEVKNEDVEFENDNSSEIDISEVKIEIEETHSNDNIVDNEPSNVENQNEDLIAKDSDKIDYDQPSYSVNNIVNTNQCITVTGSGPNRRYHCPACPFSSIRRPAVNQHYRRHTGERPFKCNECEKHFAQQSTLCFHKKTVHSLYRNFQCTLCDKNYKTKSILNAHMKTHIEKFEYTCHLCEYTSTVKRNFRKHVMRHNPEEKKYACHLCEFASSAQTNLTQHLKRHDTEKKYACHWCKYATNIRCNLVLHMKRHESKKTYTCHLCDYTTNLKEYLNAHVGRQHPEARPFKCEVCKKSCHTEAGLKLHMLKHTKAKS